MTHNGHGEHVGTREDTSRDVSHGLADIVIDLTLQFIQATALCGDSYSDNCMICLDWEHLTSFNWSAAESSGQIRHSEPSIILAGAGMTQQLFTVTQQHRATAAVVLLCPSQQQHHSRARRGCTVLLSSCWFQCSGSGRNEQLARNSRAQLSTADLGAVSGTWSGD